MNDLPARPPVRHLLSVDVSLLVMRVIVGLIFAVHGYQKLSDMSQIREGLGEPLASLVAIGEFFGGLGIMVGFLARFSAAANTLIMLGAIAMVHGKNGLLLSNNGFEYNLALIGLLLPIVLVGPGRFSIGRFLPLPKSRTSDAPLLMIE